MVVGIIPNRLLCFGTFNDWTEGDREWLLELFPWSFLGFFSDAFVYFCHFSSSDKVLMQERYHVTRVVPFPFICL